MGLDKLNELCREQLAELDRAGTAKRVEAIITGVIPPCNGKGPRYLLHGCGNREFLRFNSNSYLGLGLHPQVIAAEEEAARAYGTGPGAVRFISGTYQPHLELENRLAGFHGRPAAMIFSAAYSAVMGVLPQLISPATVVLSDELNHNCIINAIRLARPAVKAVYNHLDITDLEKKILELKGKGNRLLLVTDGVFSMRGDHVDLAAVNEVCAKHEHDFGEGIITVVDDSHGIGALGATGRGIEEQSRGRADILIATLGKGLGVNGGYVTAEPPVIDLLREKTPFYVYSNPITPAEAAAARKALEILDSPAGLKLLARLRGLTKRLRAGLIQAGYEILHGDHPIVPLMIRNTQKTASLAEKLFENSILATPINYPVVPKGDEEIRLQVAADHTEADIDQVLAALEPAR